MAAPSAQALLGRWRPEGSQPDTGAPFTEIELRPDGTLRFSVRQPSGDDTTELSYRVEDGFLVTRNTDSGAETRTRFGLGPDGSLILEHGGHSGRYVRS